MGMMECFESQFSHMLKAFAMRISAVYLKHCGYTDEVSKELYTSKRMIIKVHRVVGSVKHYDYFSIHRKVKTNSHGGKYSWYYEKYVIERNQRRKLRYTLYRYGHYPYNWE